MDSPTIIFDLDGTLIHTAPDLLDSLNHCLRAVDIPEVDPVDINRFVGFGGRVMIERAFEAHGRPLGKEQLDSLFALFHEHYSAGMPGRSHPFPGVIDTIDRFHDAGYICAVCTNKQEQLSVHLLRELALAPRFAAICGADTFDHKKPDPRHLLGTIEKAGGNPDRAIMIGDSRTDIDTAKAARIPVVAVDFGYTDRHVREFEPSHIISHFDELTVQLANDLIKAPTGQPAS